MGRDGLLKNTSLIIRRINACAVKREESKKEATKKKRKNCDLRFSISTFLVCHPFRLRFPRFGGSLRTKNHRQHAKGLIIF